MMKPLIWRCSVPADHDLKAAAFPSGVADHVMPKRAEAVLKAKWSPNLSWKGVCNTEVWEHKWALRCFRPDDVT